MVLCCVVVGVGCVSKQKGKIQSETVKIGEEHFRGVKIIISERSHVKTVIQAPLLHRYRLAKNEDKGYTNTTLSPLISDFPEGIVVYFLDDSQRTQNRVRADHAKYEDATKDILLKGNVIISTQKGDTLWTQELTYSDARHQFFTDSPVTIRGQTHLIRGRKLIADQDIKTYTIHDIHQSEMASHSLIE